MKSTTTAFALLLLVPLLAPVAAQEPVTVTVTHPTPANTAQETTLPGRTEPYEEATLFTRATGIIKERKFNIGDRVKEGEVVAIVDAAEIDHAVEAARAAVEQAEAKAANGRSLAERAGRLHGSRAVSKEEYEGRLSSLEELEAAVRQAKAELARLETQQRFATVRAPFDGVIAARNFDRGNHVRGDAAPADGWLYRLVRLDKLRFALHASPEIALRLTQGTQANISFREFPGESFPAKVAHASGAFDAASGTMRVELLLENAQLRLPAGLTAQATFRLAPVPNTYLVPTNAVNVRGGGTTVTTADDGVIRFVEILPGRNLGNRIEVTSAALTPQSSIVINPNALLRAGDKVQTQPLAEDAKGKRR